MLLLLHGVGSNEADLFGLAPYLDPRLMIVSARAPIALGPSQFGWFELQWSAAGITSRPEDVQRAAGIVAAFVDELIARYDVDPTRVFLGGFSQGAIMSLVVGLTQPEKFAGLVAMSGRLPAELGSRLPPPERLAGLPVLVVHGTEDQVLPIHEGRAARDALARLPVDLTYREYPMAHTVSAESLADVVAWLKDRLDA